MRRSRRRSRVPLPSDGYRGVAVDLVHQVQEEEASSRGMAVGRTQQIRLKYHVDTAGVIMKRKIIASKNQNLLGKGREDILERKFGQV